MKMHDMTKYKTKDKTQQRREKTYHIAGNGKGRSYKYGKLHAGCYMDCFFIYFILCFCQISLSNLIQFYLSQYQGGLYNLSYALDSMDLLFMCRCYLHSVAWFSYWIDNLGFITEGNAYGCCAASSSPLRGITNGDTTNHSCRHQPGYEDALEYELLAIREGILVAL